MKNILDHGVIEEFRKTLESHSMSDQTRARELQFANSILDCFSMMYQYHVGLITGPEMLNRLAELTVINRPEMLREGDYDLVQGVTLQSVDDWTLQFQHSFDEPPLDTEIKVTYSMACAGQFTTSNTVDSKSSALLCKQRVLRVIHQPQPHAVMCSVDEGVLILQNAFPNLPWYTKQGVAQPTTFVGDAAIALLTNIEALF